MMCPACQGRSTVNGRLCLDCLGTGVEDFDDTSQLLTVPDPDCDAPVTDDGGQPTEVTDDAARA